MAAKRYDYREYVQGNTARKLSAAPDIRRVKNPERTVRENPEKRKRPAKKTQNKPDFVSAVFMLGAILITLYVCVSYIEAQHNVTNMSKKIASMESEIYELRNKNDAAYNKINTSIDLSYVYDVAVNELGMVRAEQNQIKTYNNKKSDIVKQYGEIPEEEGTILDRALGKNKE